MQDYHDLIIWKKAFTLAKDVYRETPHFPDYEKYGITNQLRRAAVSIVANIAEGRGKYTDKDFARHLYVSRGSQNETQTLIELSAELGYLTGEVKETLCNQCREIGYLSHKFLQSLKIGFGSS